VDTRRQSFGGERDRAVEAAALVDDDVEVGGAAGARLRQRSW